MTKKAGHDRSPQTQDSHIPLYEIFSEILAGFIGIEEIPAPLVTEI